MKQGKVTAQVKEVSDWRKCTKLTLYAFSYSTDSILLSSASDYSSVYACDAQKNQRNNWLPVFSSLNLKTISWMQLPNLDTHQNKCFSRSLCRWKKDFLFYFCGKGSSQSDSRLIERLTVNKDRRQGWLSVSLLSSLLFGSDLHHSVPSFGAIILFSFEDMNTLL